MTHTADDEDNLLLTVVQRIAMAGKLRGNEFYLTKKQIVALAKAAYVAFTNRRDAENEAAYERQQQSLMESGGPDDSSYRRDMKNAGRGHLLKG